MIAWRSERPFSFCTASALSPRCQPNPLEQSAAGVCYLVTIITGDRRKYNQILLVKKAIYIGFCMQRRSYLIWSPVIVDNVIKTMLSCHTCGTVLQVPQVLQPSVVSTWYLPGHRSVRKRSDLMGLDMKAQVLLTLPDRMVVQGTYSCSSYNSR